MPLQFVNKRRQHGAISIFAAFTFLSVILFTALAVDSARLWMVKRKLQTIADISAIEASKALNCTTDISNVLANAQAAALANGFSGNLATSPNVVEIGTVAQTAGRRTFSASGLSEAVHVRVTKQVQASLIARGFLMQDVVLSADAVSLPSNAIASFGIGLSAVNINSQNSQLLNQLLGEMLGSPINLSAVSYEGIIKSRLTLANLISANGNVLTVEELLATDFTPNELLTLISDAIALSDNAAPDVLNTVSILANAAIRNTRFNLGQILNVNENIQSAVANVDLNAMNLIMSVAQVSNRSNAISLPVGVSLPGIVSINANIIIIEPAQMVIGSPAANNGDICTTARSAQIRVNVPVTATLGVLNVDLNLNVNVASGSVGLRDIQDLGNATQLTFESNTSVITTRLTNVAGDSTAKISTLGIPVAEVLLSIPPSPSNNIEVTTAIDRPIATHLPHVVSVNGSASDSFQQIFSANNTINLRLLGLQLPFINELVGSALSTVIRPLLVSLSQILIDPLLNILGIRLNNMDIIIDNVTLTNPAPLII